MMTPEELDSLTERMEEAKRIDAKHDGVLQLDIELKTLGGSPSEAIALCDSWIASEASNPMPYLLKANLLTQMAFAMMLQERMDPKAIFEEVGVLVEQAIAAAAEPNGERS